jgi:hypothetical protein
MWKAYRREADPKRRVGGERFYQPAAMTPGFHVAMAAAAGLSAIGGVVAWLTISDDALRAEPERRKQPPVAVPTHYSCALAGPPAPETRVGATG